MTELTFGIIIIAILVGFGWYIREQNRERSKLINAILAKDSQEYVNRTLAENTKIVPEINAKDPDLIPVDELNDDQWEAHIKAMNNEIKDQEIVN